MQTILGLFVLFVITRIALKILFYAIGAPLEKIKITKLDIKQQIAKI